MNMKLCKYKHIFGKERQGFHALRLFDFAVLDIVGTIIIGFLLAKHFKLNILLVIMLLFILAIFMHRLFGVNTKLNTMLFGPSACS
jgi:uncharacterized membrane protein YcaP (DUF421 family)